VAWLVVALVFVLLFVLAAALLFALVTVKVAAWATEKEPVSYAAAFLSFSSPHRPSLYGPRLRLIFQMCHHRRAMVTASCCEAPEQS
jgi:hypothetical protein